MKERPILFSGPEVRAILAGTKTQTRRVVKFPQRAAEEGVNHDDICRITETGGYFYAYDGESSWCLGACPYGQPGDRLWVRETFGDRADYAAIGALHKERYYYAADGKKAGWRYRSPVLMPRAASRITLEIVSVRVERLQDISEEDAIAEGIELGGPVGNIRAASELGASRYQFATLWDSINSKPVTERDANGERTGRALPNPDRWDANPYVWAVELKQLLNL